MTAQLRELNTSTPARVSTPVASAATTDSMRASSLERERSALWEKCLTRSQMGISSCGYVARRRISLLHEGARRENVEAVNIRFRQHVKILDI